MRFVRSFGRSFVLSFVSFVSPFFVHRLFVCLFVRSFVGRGSFRSFVRFWAWFVCLVVCVRCSAFPFRSFAFGVFAASRCTCDEMGCHIHCVMIDYFLLGFLGLSFCILVEDLDLGEAYL